MTTGYPRGSCRESWKTRGNVGRGGRGKNGRTAWQRIFGYLALDSAAWYSTVREGGCRFMAAWVKEEENASEHRQRKRETEEADKVGVAPGVTV